MGPLFITALVVHPAFGNVVLEGAVTPDARESLPIARLALELEGEGTEPGPVWVWERVEFGPCIGVLEEASRTRSHRRWTWLSSRDSLRVGVCEADGTFEVRLERAGRAALPAVDGIFLATMDGDLVMRRDEERWLGDPMQRVSVERRSTTFEPAAEGRYRELRDALEVIEESEQRVDLWDFDWVRDDLDFDDLIWDGAESDLWMDGPDGMGGGIGLGL